MASDTPPRATPAARTHNPRPSGADGRTGSAGPVPCRPEAGAGQAVAALPPGPRGFAPETATDRPQPPENALGEAQGRYAVGHRGPRLDVRLPVDLDAARAVRLGDRLVQALAAGATHIVLWVLGEAPPSPEAASLVNSLGRHMARDGRWRRVGLRGAGPGFEALVAAYRQGLAPRPARRKEGR
ncbi:MAG: hypothetical protein ACP59X_16035 [Solidesulfovibrio sp. DCME]|uniref:hypothetical protein n=1 Tax=Solidesulfovibrio sp. DCME TaxID=3447380 RepID=UPI003D0E14B1